ncbi:hypothetical protein ZWY2020_016357 [Hordeum vulgare]|nr:hypothetical protein ZWY2020_016357 [Hordeum vulgare]
MEAFPPPLLPPLPANVSSVLPPPPLHQQAGSAPASATLLVEALGKVLILREQTSQMPRIRARSIRRN